MLYKKCFIDLSTGISAHTFVTEIVDHDDFLEKIWRTHVDDTVDGPHQGRPALVMEDENDAGGRQILRVMPVLAPAHNGQTPIL